MIISIAVHLLFGDPLERPVVPVELPPLNCAAPPGSPEARAGRCYERDLAALATGPFEGHRAAIEARQCDHGASEPDFATAEANLREIDERTLHYLVQRYPEMTASRVRQDYQAAREALAQSTRAALQRDGCDGYARTGQALFRRLTIPLPDESE